MTLFNVSTILAPWFKVFVWLRMKCLFIIKTFQKTRKLRMKCSSPISSRIAIPLMWEEGGALLSGGSNKTDYKTRLRGDHVDENVDEMRIQLK